jgi:hypothetical protein
MIGAPDSSKFAGEGDREEGAEGVREEAEAEAVVETEDSEEGE